MNVLDAEEMELNVLVVEAVLVALAGGPVGHRIDLAKRKELFE